MLDMRGASKAVHEPGPRYNPACDPPVQEPGLSHPRRPSEAAPDSDRPRRPRERAQIRAALALEEAGELQEAARMFEYVGEHAQAASLRLEHADTLRDEQQRLAVLREGCARNLPNTEQGQALHRALGEALLRVADGLEPGARRRALRLEAAQALEDGQRPGEAGRLYQELGLLSRAAKAYTEAGEIDQLEAIHAILEGHEQRQREQRNLELEVETAVATGRRALAHALLLEQIRDVQREGRTPSAALAAALHELEHRLIRGRSLSLSVRPVDERGLPTALPTIVRVIGRPQLRLGRAPQCELNVAGAALSREHAELALSFAADGSPNLVVRDLGSRAGSFLDGEALLPGEDVGLLDLDVDLDRDRGPSRVGERTTAWDGARELALGIATSFDLWLRAGAGAGAGAGDERPVVLLRQAGVDDHGEPHKRAWTLFAPLGGPLWLTPTRALPITLGFEHEQIVALAGPDVQVSLAGTPVGHGAAIELLLHDRLRLEPADGPAFEIEVEELWG
jgi:tetratricopeptide (TPR) repeat protein